jgi:hypothetical protein
MIAFQGLALIAQLLVAGLLVIALIGFGVRRTFPWLVCSVAAIMMLVAATLLVINSSSV